MKKMLFAACAAMALLTSCNEGTPKASLKTDIDTLSYELGIASSPGEQLAMYLTQMGSDSAYSEAFMKGFKEGMKSGDDKQKMAYFLGVQAGLQTKTQMFAGVQHQVFGEDSTKELSTRNYLAGFSDAMEGKCLLKKDGKPLSREDAGMELQTRMQEMAAKVLEEKYGENKKASEDFIAQKAKEAGISKLPEGVLYKVIKEGTGALPKVSDVVKVTYKGTLTTGQVFDESKEAVSMPIGRVIKGWQAALVHMPVGSKWEIYIPWDLAYGAQGSGPMIPPFSALVFEVSLEEIVAQN
ncbi:MAG: FKBP-type peptidyl-prolyl cis-trans isomerase [Alloprevotella sp.]